MTFTDCSRCERHADIMAAYGVFLSAAQWAHMWRSPHMPRSSSVRIAYMKRPELFSPEMGFTNRRSNFALVTAM